MTTFTIDNDNTVTAFATAPEADACIPPTGFDAMFTSEKELAKAAAEWPITRLVEIWNGFAGTPGFGNLKPVKKFENRAKACARIWSAIQALATKPAAAPPAAEVAPAAAKPPKATRPAKKQPKAAPAAKTPVAKAEAKAKPARADSKKAIVIKMLQRKNGASNEEIMAATGWQTHSVRGFIAGTLKKAGLTAESFKTDAGERRYRLPA